MSYFNDAFERTIDKVANRLEMEILSRLEKQRDQFINNGYEIKDMKIVYNNNGQQEVVLKDEK